MSRPADKTELLEESQKEYEALEKFLSSLNPAQMLQSGALGEWSVKDVLAHLHEWQQMFFRWYEAGRRGEMPAVPAEGYKWNQLPALNQAIYEKYCDYSLDDVKSSLRESHGKTISLIEALSESDLFAQGLYPWIGKSHLATYITANTGSHYRWARTEMRKTLHKSR